MPLYVVNDEVACGGYIHTYGHVCLHVIILLIIALFTRWEIGAILLLCFLNLQRGRTALHHAAVQGSKECLKLLVYELTADPEEVDSVCDKNVTAPKGFIYIDVIT